MASGDANKHRVVFSESMRQELKRMAQWVMRLGQGSVMLATLEMILDGLQKDPATFGYPTRRLPTMEAVQYSALRGPIQVTYAVHNFKPIVFVRAIKYYPEYGWKSR